MAIKLGVIMDPIEAIKYEKDTTLGILFEANKRCWEIDYIQPHSLFLTNGETTAVTQTLSPKENPSNWFHLGPEKNTPLQNLDIILIRQDPPVNQSYIYCTQLLEPLEKKGVLLVNKPESIRSCNEKLFATEFKSCMPPTCVTSLFGPLFEFQNNHQDIIIKPLDGMGGKGIFRIKEGDQNLKVVHEVLSNNSELPIMAQKYIPEIREGDKRILMIDGSPIPYALARVPPTGALRGNLAAGGTGVLRELSERDQWICEQVGPALKKRGLIFVGLDIIGDYLTEINVTSPTCLREIESLSPIAVASKLLDCLEEKLPILVAEDDLSK